jgi:predicted anti-sigma-YlaC factor YlaD
VTKVFEKPNIPARCRKFEARFEDYLAGAPDAELSDHLLQCVECRSVLADSRLAGDLLREAWEPASAPSHAFLANVMSRIQEEEARAESPAAFWLPFELLASRLSLTAAVLLLAMSVYIAKFAPPHRSVSLGPVRSELSAADFPQPPGDPVSNEEVLVSLSERNYGR